MDQLGNPGHRSCRIRGVRCLLDPQQTVGVRRIIAVRKGRDLSFRFIRSPSSSIERFFLFDFFHREHFLLFSHTSRELNLIYKKNNLFA